MRHELEIDGMTCLSCAQSVERALRRVPGVEQATVSYPTRRATVVASADVRTEVLRETVAKTGYQATVLGDADTTTASRVAHSSVSTHKPATRRDAQRSSSSGAADDTGDADYDLVVIGSGGAGMAAAIRASELGATAAVVEGADVIGGTCVNVGCIPSKNLIEAAQHYHAARSGFPGITPCEPQLAWEQVVTHKRELVESLRQQKYIDVLGAYEGVTLLRGDAALTAADQDGAARVRVGDRHVRARRVVVATGARPGLPPIPGLDEVGALDSTSVMELERLPASMLVIGAGAIGLELGQAFQRFGVRVIVVEAMERILPTETAEVSAVLQAALENEGIEFHTSTLVTRAERTASGVRIDLAQGSLVGHLEAEVVLVATGRVPNVEGLGLDAVGVHTYPRGHVIVDEYMRTSNARIFAAGDVTPNPAYVYVAALTGGIAAQAALADIVGEEPIAADLSTVPRVTFTDPQVASVGLSEIEARAAGFNVKATTMAVEHLARAAVSYRRQGTITLVAEEGTDRLLGAQVVSPNAGDIIGEAVFAVRFGLTTRDIVSTLHPYLTWGEAFKLAGQTFTRDVAKLSCCA